jgi:hypothetical protein
MITLVIMFPYPNNDCKKFVPILNCNEIREVYFGKKDLNFESISKETLVFNVSIVEMGNLRSKRPT